MKKKLLFTVFSSLALCAGVLMAEETPKKPGEGKRPSAADRAAKMIETADKDGDGKLDAAELTAHFEAMGDRQPGKKPARPDGKKPKQAE